LGHRIRRTNQVAVAPYASLLKATVEAFPAKLAVCDRQWNWSYRQLDWISNRIAHELQKRGIGPGRVVGLCRARDAASLAALLAIFKLRAAYLPIDPALPVSRRRYMAEHSRCALVLGQRELDAWLADGPLEKFATVDGEPDDLAYVCFTSGSTGLPKGAMMTQGAMVNHLLAKVEDLQITAEDVIAQTAPQGFDLSVWQYLAGGVVGAQTVIIEQDDVAYPPTLLERVLEYRVTVLQMVPSYLAVVTRLLSQESRFDGHSALRVVVAAGEVLPATVARQWFALHRIALINAYGPTECGADVTHHLMARAPEGSSVPIGRAVRGASLIVVDESLRTVAPGAVGELLIGGPQVGCGYINSPDLTAASFIHTGFGPGRWYRTGDLVREQDGLFWFIGRVDHQIKLRGYRIEPAEIEAVLRDRAGVRAAAVVCHTDGTRSELIALTEVEVAANAANAAQRATEILEELRNHLPAHMIPHSIFFLHSLPLTRNGKIDRTQVARIVSELRPFDASQAL
jgi:amino acid adenylation domain-containing protein